MKNAMNALIYMFIGFLILIQQGEGELLIQGWNGLAFASIACMFMSVLHIISAINQVDEVIERAPRYEDEDPAI